MIEENAFDHFQEFLQHFNGQFNIIDEQIDVELQVEYFKKAGDIRKNMDKEQLLLNKDKLFDSTDLDQKRNILAGLAALEDVTAFRTIERFVKGTPEEEIKNWAILAYNECKMRLESSLLEQNQVFISTGLGGKGQKLRFFIVLFGIAPELALSEFQQKLINDESEDACLKCKAEIEEIQFNHRFATLLLLVPFSSPIDNLFTNIIHECNQYGNFLSNNFLITNVKKLSSEEIMQFAVDHQTDFKE